MNEIEGGWTDCLRSVGLEYHADAVSRLPVSTILWILVAQEPYADS
jgi:hypothetical protein